VRKSSPTLGYLGWTGHHNMGDEAINAALVDALHDITFVPVPIGPSALLRRARDLPELRRIPLLLGGGTVLGRRIWRIHLRLALAVTAPTPAFMLGAGVEDPDFTRPGHLSERGELAHWGRILDRFHEVAVRGPRSAELLADAGIPARVVGDPAFLLEPQPAPAGDPGLLGVNLGTSDDLWGHDQAAVVRHTADAVRSLGGTGWRFRFLVVNPADRPDAERCVALAGLMPDQWELVDADDPYDYLRAVAGCGVVLAERLHAGILAARAGVVPVMLEYQPKCRDFLRSVALDRFGVRTDKVAGGQLVELVHEVQAGGAPLRTHLADAVEELRRRLLGEVAQIRALATASPLTEHLPRVGP
jgi:polysaccharide pyruvyl transferase WcaK-like protein